MFLEAISAVSGSGLGTLSNSTNLLGVSSSSNLSSLSSSSSPFEEVKKDALTVPISPQLSLARQRFSEECEAVINEQINVEYNVSYVYHSLFAYFDRDNVALKGLAKFFKESSEEEREHAEKLMQYQNIRGGRVKLHTITNPPSEFDHVEKGDALYAMEIALSLEKLTNEKLLNVHSVADQNNDPQMADFIESEFLQEQVEAIKKIAEYVTQLRMVGKGHGVWHFRPEAPPQWQWCSMKISSQCLFLIIVELLSPCISWE
ncbi:Ferritin-1 [Forsythia ovata]|uniref:Ferritin n=1 Tax=Forsythia ovata TaxID=205694 RepID=A0ABD1TB79_9LAMI